MYVHRCNLKLLDKVALVCSEVVTPTQTYNRLFDFCFPISHVPIIIVCLYFTSGLTWTLLMPRLLFKKGTTKTVKRWLTQARHERVKLQERTKRLGLESNTKCLKQDVSQKKSTQDIAKNRSTFTGDTELLLTEKCNKSTAIDETYQIFVTTLEGSTLTLNVVSSDDVACIFEIIHDRTKIPPHELSLYHSGGRELIVGHTLMYYNITKHSNIFCSLHLYGSSKVKYMNICHFLCFYPDIQMCT